MYLPSLKDAIDWFPVTASPETLVTEILLSMSQPKRYQPLSHSLFPIQTEWHTPTSIPCVAIITPMRQVVGLLTDRELVSAIASGSIDPDLTASEIMVRSPQILRLTENTNFLTALSLFQQYSIQYLPVVDAQDSLVGTISLNRLFQILDPRSLYTEIEQIEAEKLDIWKESQLELKQLVQERTAQLHQANRALQTLSECNQVLVRATAEAELLHDICQVILETGGYRLAWISFAPSDIPPPTPFCLPCKDVQDLGDYLSFNCSGSEEIDFSEIVLQISKACVIRYKTPSTSGYGAAISLPLKHSYAANPPTANCFGTLNIYAASPDAFDPAEVQLLSKLAADLAYGIIALRTRSERERTQQELDRIFELSLDWLFVADFEGYFQRINPAVSQTLGYSVQELLSKPWLTLVHPEDRVASLREMEKLAEGKSTIYFENRYCAADGSYKWLAWTAVPVLAEKVVYGVARDVTERKWAQDALLKSQQKLALHVQQTPLAVIEWNLQGEVMEWNPAAEQVFGYSKAEVLGRQAGEFLVPEWLKPSLSQLLHQMLTGTLNKEAIAFEHLDLEIGNDTNVKVAHENLTKDGRTIICEWYNTPLVDRTGKAIGVASLVLDTTKRKQAEQALQQANGALELRVEERTAELRQTLEQLQVEIQQRQRLEVELRASLEKEKELNELKSRFVSMVSHDFRTPLTTIQSSAELLEHYGPQWNEEKRLIHLRRMQTSVQRMTQLLEDILTIGRAEAGKLDFRPQPLNLYEFSLQLVEEMQLFGNQHEIRFRASGGSYQAIADEKLLHHIFSNLLSNAIKYSVPQSQIEFTLDCPSLSEGMAIFQVCDRGIGIPPEEIPMLFTPFHRCSNVNHISGTGLGLTIVQKCVDLHGGAIAVDSTLGMGTTFTVMLPLGESHRGEVEI